MMLVTLQPPWGQVRNLTASAPVRLMESRRVRWCVMDAPAKEFFNFFQFEIYTILIHI